MLEKNDYVLLVSTDFTMALDSVRHSTLMQKMAVIDLPDNIYNWIANYFEQRGHVTKIHDIISAIVFTNASIIQGPSWPAIIYSGCIRHACEASSFM